MRRILKEVAPVYDDKILSDILKPLHRHQKAYARHSTLNESPSRHLNPHHSVFESSHDHERHADHNTCLLGSPGMHKIKKQGEGEVSTSLNLELKVNECMGSRSPVFNRSPTQKEQGQRNIEIM